MGKFDDHAGQLSIAANLDMIDAYDWVLAVLEREILTNAQALLKTIPGVGRIIALNLLYEIEDISRFSKLQNFVSYCRLVKCAKESNGKKYASVGKKIGNTHLRWAFFQAAQLFLKGDEPGKRFYNKLCNKHGKGRALSILVHKLGRAVYFMLKKRRAFDMDTFFATN